MGRVQVLNNHKRHAAPRRHPSQELLQRLQASCGSTDPNDGKQRGRRWDELYSADSAPGLPLSALWFWFCLHDPFINTREGDESSATLRTL